MMGVRSGLFRIGGKTRVAITRGDSGKEARRHFCPECCSLLFGTPEAAPSIVTIYAGSLDDMSVFKPEAIQYTRSRPKWDLMFSLIPQFDGPAPARKLWPRSPRA
jgi:hypothetical protein